MLFVTIPDYFYGDVFLGNRKSRAVLRFSDAV